MYVRAFLLDGYEDEIKFKIIKKKHGLQRVHGFFLMQVLE